VYAEKWRIAAEEDFLHKLASFKEKGEIRHSLMWNDELTEARILLKKFSDNQFESEIQDCLDSIKASKFRSALEVRGVFKKSRFIQTRSFERSIQRTHQSIEIR